MHRADFARARRSSLFTVLAGSRRARGNFISLPPRVSPCRWGADRHSSPPRLRGVEDVVSGGHLHPEDGPPEGAHGGRARGARPRPSARGVRARGLHEPSPDVGLSPGTRRTRSPASRAGGRGGADRWFRDRARHHPYGAHPGAARSGAPRDPVTPRASARPPARSPPTLRSPPRGHSAARPVSRARRRRREGRLRAEPRPVPASAWRGADGVGARHRARYHPVTAGARGGAAAAAAAAAAAPASSSPRRRRRRTAPASAGLPSFAFLHPPPGAVDPTFEQSALRTSEMARRRSPELARARPPVRDGGDGTDGTEDDVAAPRVPGLYARGPRPSASARGDPFSSSPAALDPSSPALEAARANQLAATEALIRAEADRARASAAQDAERAARAGPGRRVGGAIFSKRRRR